MALAGHIILSAKLSSLFFKIRNTKFLNPVERLLDVRLHSRKKRSVLWGKNGLTSSRARLRWSKVDIIISGLIFLIVFTISGIALLTFHYSSGN